jgi:hypothetical protein
MMAKPEYVPDILSPTARAQLRRQYRYICAGALVFNKNLLQIMKFILADLRVCRYNLLRRGAELQVA